MIFPFHKIMQDGWKMIHEAPMRNFSKDKGIQSNRVTDDHGLFSSAQVL